MNVREKTLIVLENLFQGHELEIEIVDGIKHRIILYKKELKIIAIKTNSKNEILDEVFLECDISLNDFIKICDKISNKEIATIAASNVMTCYKASKR